MGMSELRFDLDWSDCRGYFQWDGSLRDIYVLGANLADWQVLFEYVQEQGLPFTSPLGSRHASLPDDVGELFGRGPESERTSLSIHLHGMILNTHFFVADEIELDLDPREVKGAREFAHLLGFLRDLARLVGKQVCLTPENLENLPYIEVFPDGRLSHWQSEATDLDSRLGDDH